LHIIGNDTSSKKGGFPIEPVIAITCSHDQNRQPDQYQLAGAYCRAIKGAGGIPVLLPALDALNRPLGSFCQGLLLSGGGDFDPALFHEAAHGRLGRVDPERDRWEISLIRRACREGLPVFGICRGLQAMNVALGGSLYQDLPSQYRSAGSIPLLEHNQENPGHEVSHQVRIAEDSLLFKIIGAAEIWTNSHHHQAVKDLAPGLTICARSDDGVIEGIEGTGGFFLGVQWHPERLSTPEAVRLFTAFVQACRERKTSDALTESILVSRERMSCDSHEGRNND
jgi:putative glutamine amidotransferase